MNPCCVQAKTNRALVVIANENSPAQTETSHQSYLQQTLLNLHEIAISF